MHQPLLRVFIGYDPVETVAWHTFAHSILRQSSIPVALVPVNLGNLGGKFTDDWALHSYNQSLDLCLPPLSVLVFRRDDVKSLKRAEEEERRAAEAAVPTA